MPADESDVVRCATRQELEHRGCLPSEVVDPHGKQHILEDRPLSKDPQHNSITQLAPQRITLQLRPGGSFKGKGQSKAWVGRGRNLFDMADPGRRGFPVLLPGTTFCYSSQKYELGKCLVL